MAAQNAVLDNHNATYGIGAAGDSHMFEVVAGSDTLAFTSAPTRNGNHTVNVTAAGDNVFASGNNHRMVTVTVTGVSGAPPPPRLCHHLEDHRRQPEHHLPGDGHLRHRLGRRLHRGGRLRQPDPQIRGRRQLQPSR